MDAVDIIKVCGRRWYVMLPILVGAAGVSSQLVQAQETTYTAAASYGLVRPGPATGADAEADPFGAAGDVLVGEALEAQLDSRETQARLGSDDTRGWGPGDAQNLRSYDVRIPEFETTYEVRAWGEDAQEVRDVVERVIAAAPDIAGELQARAGVTPPQRYEPFVLAPTQVEALPSGGTVKLVVAVMGIGVLMGAAWSVVVDRALLWRRTRRARAGEPAADDDLAAGPEPEPEPEPEREPEPVPTTEPRRTNGRTKGTTNGRANGTTNGKTNGRTNGAAKGTTNGATNGTSTSPLNGHGSVNGRAGRGPSGRR